MITRRYILMRNARSHGTDLPARASPRKQQHWIRDVLCNQPHEIFKVQRMKFTSNILFFAF